jgi:hypothetical protein
MNSRLEAPSDQSDLLHEPGDAVADAAQRDLFEFFAAPPLAADLAPTEPGATAQPVDEYLTVQEEIEPDKLSPEAVVHDETGPGEDSAADDPCGSPTGSAVPAVDEVNLANLRRLETTLSWLQNEVEACRLPRAAPLPPVPGLRVVEPIIDRSSLERILQRPPTLPIWLQEQQQRPQPPPTRETGPLWSGTVRFLIACAIAAPLSYCSAVATSPLRKHLVEVTQLVSPHPVASERAASRGPETRERRHASIAGAQTAPAQRAPALVSAVEPPAAPASLPADSALRAGPEMPAARATEIPGLGIPALGVPARTAPAQVQAIEARDQAQTTHGPTPQIEAAQARIIPPPATTGLAEAQAKSPPPAERAAMNTAGAQDVALLIDQGRQFFEAGDLIAARILFMRAANAGNAAAAIAMGSTYDPVVLADRGVRGLAPDLDKARSWYERAKEMGSPEGPRRLEMLANR